LKQILFTLILLTFLLLPRVAFCLPDFPAADHRAANLHQFFSKYKCPEPYNEDAYVQAANAYNLDYRILPAVSVQESSCGKHYPVVTNNLWGWDSAQTGFGSIREGIDFVSEQLAGGRHYQGKSLIQKLRAYNPNAEYAPKIMALMKEIE
jgi:hypothetical protein